MKKLVIALVFLFSVFTLNAQSDTLKIDGPVKFEKELVISKTGSEVMKYYAFYKGKYYDTTKTSYERYYQILKFRGYPCAVLITTGKTKKQKIIVL